jgi:trimethylamine:corrinoid methyltransferase-like protein
MSSGAKDANARAKDRMKDILATHTPEPLEPEARKNLDSLIKEYTRSWGIERLEERCW